MEINRDEIFNETKYITGPEKRAATMPKKPAKNARKFLSLHLKLISFARYFHTSDEREEEKGAHNYFRIINTKTKFTTRQKALKECEREATGGHKNVTQSKASSFQIFM